MEKVNPFEQKTLIHELTKGKELANQLRNNLDPLKPMETCESLLEKIISSYDNALSMLNLKALLREPLPLESPQSDGSDRDSVNQNHREVFKKRKTSPQWSEQVRISSGNGLEGPLDDGHSWRKYGQKDILGASYPRAYYRCTHRHSQGCLATKQVQRMDNDPSIYEVTYKGRHSCIKASLSSSSIFSVEKETPKQDRNQLAMKQQGGKQRKPHEIGSKVGSILKVETEDLDTKDKIFPSFTFPSTLIDSENVASHFFSETTANHFMETCSPTFGSPATSDSNYFSLSQCQMNDFGICYNLQSADSGLTDIISTPTSVTNSPFGDLDFGIDQVDFDPDFPLDTLEFLNQ